MLSRLVITFLPRGKHFLISWLQSPTVVILEPPKIKKRLDWYKMTGIKIAGKPTLAFSVFDGALNSPLRHGCSIFLVNTLVWKRRVFRDSHWAFVSIMVLTVHVWRCSSVARAAGK